MLKSYIFIIVSFDMSWDGDMQVRSNMVTTEIKQFHTDNRLVQTFLYVWHYDGVYNELLWIVFCLLVIVW
jgi:hypothetical protein